MEVLPGKFSWRMIRSENIRSKNLSAIGYPVGVSTVGQTARTADAAEDPAEEAACSAPMDAERPDLTWLLHRAAQNMRIAFDEAARGHGLADARDWIVLTALSTGPRQTQLALAQSLGVDKTTMTSLLDRLEGRGFITRVTDRHDRRARIPELTADGRRVQAEVTTVRDGVEACLLAEFSPDERLLLRDLLTRLAGESAKATGSCI
jgi:MarR family transcriptional regulator, organic hydroperoxide resistance regulator